MYAIKDKLKEKKEELIMKLLGSSSTEEMIWMYEHEDWNDFAKKCFFKELQNRGIEIPEVLCHE